MKLTKEDLDKVRNIEGFPIGSDEDIIALSRPPYYTACPNPFIKEFIEKNGKPYDEEKDDYHCEPFTADVSEGKNDPIYMAHSYHTKVPYKAIMRYILHYTKPGDIILDGFCGTGMTGVAAQMCACPDDEFKCKLENEAALKKIQWGARKTILSDLSPAATFIAHNYNVHCNIEAFERKAEKILEEVEAEYGWMYKTNITNSIDEGLFDDSGRINYTVWSDVYVCPSCSKEYVFYDLAYDEENNIMRERLCCPHCKTYFEKNDCEHAWRSIENKFTGKMERKIVRKPVHINYSIGSTRYTKKPDENDFSIISKVDDYQIKKFVPHERMPKGSEGRRNDRIGMMYIDQFYTKRTLILLAAIYDQCRNDNTLLFWFTSCLPKLTVMNRYMPQHGSRALVGPRAGTLYVSPLWVENEVISQFRFQLGKIVKALSHDNDDVCITTQSSLHLNLIPNNSIDYIFTDPPFGSNLQYSELSCFWEAWLKIRENNVEEAIINKSHNKAITDYQEMITAVFNEYYRVLKPGHWITIEFHNSKNNIWNVIGEAIANAGFITAHIKVLDKQKGTVLQLTARSAVKQDLVISAYKPKNSFVKNFRQKAGNPEMVWEFVRQYLAQQTKVTNTNNKIDHMSERCDYLLFDRMVAYHIMNGIPVPMDAHTFYDGLRQRFIERDGMFFNADQVNKYDEKRLTMEVEDQQMALFVTDEKNAIAWLHQLLDKTHLSYQEIQPKYLQELHQDKREEIPELLDMLKENFVQDAAGKWYIPDLTDAADLAKLRRKKLLKEFYDSYAAGKQKIKVARQEAIRAGFDDCWAKKDYATIVHVGDRLPEAVLQEDQALLMYYDNASSRV